MQVDFKLGDSCELFIDEVGCSELDQKNQFYPVEIKVLRKNRQTNGNNAEQVKPEPRDQVSFDDEPSVGDEETMFVEAFKSGEDAINDKQDNEYDVYSK